ncbi:hypothetical protein [Hyphomicrobium sp. DY-1]|uniref:hypothetical protein n=1 Tax=Hyphomicrobium sp. DY-1 TaxID=3075650 RepID=UPI0039C4564A
MPTPPPTSLTLYFVADNPSVDHNRDLLCWATSPDEATAFWCAYYETDDTPHDMLHVPTDNPKPGAIPWHHSDGIRSVGVEQ